MYAGWKPVGIPLKRSQRWPRGAHSSAQCCPFVGVGEKNASVVSTFRKEVFQIANGDGGHLDNIDSMKMDPERGMIALSASQARNLESNGYLDTPLRRTPLYPYAVAHDLLYLPPIYRHCHGSGPAQGLPFSTNWLGPFLQDTYIVAKSCNGIFELW
jgi:hypothetical protein